MEFFPSEKEERSRDEQGERFGDGDGKPDAVDAEYFRQEQYRGDLNGERAQERNERAGRAVVESRKERRAEDVEAADKERQRIDAQRVRGDIAQLCIVADEKMRDGACQQNGRGRHQKARDGRKAETFSQEAPELRVVLRAVVIANDGRNGDGVAKEKRHKNEVDVHDDAVGAHAVLPCDCHELHIVEYAHKRGRKVADHLARAIIAGLAQRAQIKMRARQAQRRVVGTQEVDERDQRANDLGKRRGKRRAEKPEGKHIDEQKVERHVGKSCEHRYPQPKARLFRCSKKALEAVLQHEKRKRHKQDAPVKHAVVNGQLRCPCGVRDGAGEDEHDSGERCAANAQHQHEHRKYLVCFLRPALTKRFGDERAAACADHEAERRQRHDDGEDEVDGGEGIFSHEVGDKKAVYNAIDRRDDHHQDAGRDKAQQLFAGEMIGK